MFGLRQSRRRVSLADRAHGEDDGIDGWRAVFVRAARERDDEKLQGAEDAEEAREGDDKNSRCGRYGSDGRDAGGADARSRRFGGLRVVDTHRRRVVRGWLRAKMG